MRTTVVLANLLAAGCLTAAGPQAGLPFYQQEKNGCGAASVAMVMSYWGSETPAPRAIYDRLYLPEEKGIRLADMKRYLEEAGFRAFTLRGTIADAETHAGKGRPIIAGLKAGRTKPVHFVVVSGVTADHVWLHDPSRRAPHRLKRAAFEKQWAAGGRWMLLATPVNRVYRAGSAAPSSTIRDAR